LVASGEQRSDGSSKSLVGSITKSDGALGEFVGLEGVDAVADNRIVEEMLDESRVLSRAHIAVDLVGHDDGCGLIARFEIRSIARSFGYEIETITERCEVDKLETRVRYENL
jgi:hypothetical protein